MMKYSHLKKYLLVGLLLALAIGQAQPVLAQGIISVDLEAGATISPAMGGELRELRAEFQELAESADPDAAISVNRHIYPRPALCYGANLTYDFTDKIGFRTGFMISPRGYRKVIKDKSNGEAIPFLPLRKEVAATQLRYLDIPLLAVYRLGNHFELNGGLVISRRISAVRVIRLSSKSESSPESSGTWENNHREKTDLSPATRSFRVGAQLGISTVDLKPFNFEFRIQRSNQIYRDTSTEINDLTLQLALKIPLI